MRGGGKWKIDHKDMIYLDLGLQMDTNTLNINFVSV